MPVVPPNQNVSFANIQVCPPGTGGNTTNPYQNQQNFGGMIGRVLAENPNAGAMAPLWLNDAVRVIYDRKTWFSLFLKGQALCPQATTKGQATVVTGSTSVQGSNGTVWTTALVGQQFRVGYNNPIYTIVAVDPIGQTLQLELPWGGRSGTSGYFIVQSYFNFGANIKYVKIMVNMQLGYKFHLHATQDTLNSFDPWRQTQNFPWVAAGMPLAPDGGYLMELWPNNWIQQAFPFMAYVQPPNLVNDGDPLPAYIRSDVVIKWAIAEALVWRGPKNNAYFNAERSRDLKKEFEVELQNMATADENLYRTGMTLLGEDLPFFNPGGALWSAQHAVMATHSGGPDF